MQKERDLEAQVEALKKRIEGEDIVHKDMMDFLERKHKELAALANHWEEKYATDMEAKEKELAKMESDRERDKEILAGLQERWDQLEAEKAAKEAEKRRLIELERLQREEEARRHAAAIKIQRAGRAYVKRRNES